MDGFFWHFLATKLNATVHEAKQRVDAAEFASWKEYYRANEAGGPRTPEEERNDHRTSITNMILANTYRSSDSQPCDLDDFSTFPRPKPEIPEGDQQKATAALCRQWAHAQNAAASARAQ